MKTEKNVKDYDELVKETLKKYTKNSLEYLLVKLYQYATLRDDYSNMILTKDESDLQKNKNYMILPPKTGNASILIQKHKTKRVNGDIRYTFNEEVTKLIRNYVKIKPQRSRNGTFRSSFCVCCYARLTPPASSSQVCEGRRQVSSE